jgi:hypothetical protein
MFKNPMMLMMVLGAALLFATPYLAVSFHSDTCVALNEDAFEQKQVGPEPLKELQDRTSQPTIASLSQSNGESAIRKEEKREETSYKATAARRQSTTSGSTKNRNARIRRK